MPPDDSHRATRVVDLVDVLLDARDILGLATFDAFMFGSRRHRTGDPKADIDILLFTTAPVTADQADRIRELEPYLDLFCGEGGSIRSVINDSALTRPTRDDLLETLNAIPLFLDGNWQADADPYRIQEVQTGFSPAKTVLANYREQRLRPPEVKADILVVTALPKEFRAAIRALDSRVPLGSGVARARITDRFGFIWKVEIVLVGSMGSVPAALATLEALRRTRAAHVVLLGIAAGVPERVKLGDVVVPEQILYYETQKVTDDTEENAPYWRHTYDPVRVAASVMGEIRGLGGLFDTVTIHADIVIASGDKVVASSEFRDKVCSAHRKTAALDMESYGVARAAERSGSRVTIIKSICDLGDSMKDDKFQEFSAMVSASTFSYLLTGGAFRLSTEG